MSQKHIKNELDNELNNDIAIHGYTYYQPLHTHTTNTNACMYRSLSITHTHTERDTVINKCFTVVHECVRVPV